MNQVNIIKLPINRWEEYRSLRLEAVKNDPLAFAAAYKEELDTSKEKWKSRLKSANSLMLFAEADGKLVGMVGAFWENKEKRKHIANIVSMFVKREYRGHWIGRMLLETMIKKINKNSDIRKLKLGVVSTQTTALNMYQKLGFKIVGRFVKELKNCDAFYDEYLLEKYLQLDSLR